MPEVMLSKDNPERVCRLFVGGRVSEGSPVTVYSQECRDTVPDPHAAVENALELPRQRDIASQAGGCGQRASGADTLAGEA
jgi:hypothetical protein